MSKNKFFYLFGITILYFSLFQSTSYAANTYFSDHEVGVDRPGNDLVDYPSFSSAGDCENQCANNTSCNAWTYNNNTKICYLKNAVGTPALNTDGISGYRKSTTTLSFSDQEVGVDRPGNDLVNYPSFSSAGDCENQCANNTSCNAWTYNNNTKICYLKNAVGTPASNTDGISGYRKSTATLGFSDHELGVNRPGHDLGHNFSDSAGNCENQCANNTSCNAWSYNNPSKICYLKNAVGTSVSEPGITTSGYRKSTATLGFSDHELGVNRPGHDLGHNFSDSAGNCENQCANNTSCNAWSYNNPHKICYLKNAVGTSVSEPGITTSGYRKLTKIKRDAPYFTNILKNPNGELGNMNNWGVLSSTASKFDIFSDAGGKSYFRTGFGKRLNQKSQLVDLVAAGFSPSLMDEQPPILISELFERDNCNDSYILDIELLDKNQSTLYEWTTGVQDGAAGCSSNSLKTRVENILMQYGPGVRYIRWTDGGNDRSGDTQSTNLKHAYLAIQPVNLLNRPEKLSSWNVLENGGSGVLVEGSDEATQFITSSGWFKREQLIDLVKAGYSPETLDKGFPFQVSGTYGMEHCPDQFFMKVEVLDVNKKVLKAFDSGIRTHKKPHVNGICLPDPSGYYETIMATISEYGSGARFVRWQDGGKDTEGWAGNFGVRLSSPYLGLINHTGVPVSADRSAGTLGWFDGILAGAVTVFAVGASCVFGIVNFGTSCAAAIAVASVGVGVVTTVATTDFSEPQVVTPGSKFAKSIDCDSECVIKAIKANLPSKLEDTLWGYNENNAIEIIAGPSAKTTSTIDSLGVEFRTKVVNLVRGAKTFVDITNLDAIQGEFTSKLDGALLNIHNNLVATNPNKKVVVRVFIGRSPSPKDALGVTPAYRNTLKENLGNLVTHLPKDSNIEVHIAGGINLDLQTFPRGGWNHSKIVAVDGIRAITGGINMWGSYLGPEPVFDTAIKVEGPSAIIAHYFADELWKHRLVHYSWKKGQISEENSKSQPPLLRNPSRGLPPEIIKSNNNARWPKLRVLGVGQHVKTDKSSVVHNTILELIGMAKSSIWLSQQSLASINIGKPMIDKHFLPKRIDARLGELLAQQAIDGVKVKIILSNPDAPYETTASITNDALYKKIGDSISYYKLDGNIETLCSNLEIAYLGAEGIGITGNKYKTSGKGLANHSKTVMVDNKVFVIGSHNLYPQTPAWLSEFAYVVGNEKEATKYSDQYWHPVWNSSEVTPKSTCLAKMRLALAQKEMEL